MKSTKTSCFLLGILFLSVSITGCRNQDYYTRGVGIYPGNPPEDFSPELVPGNENYRNIDRHRPAFNSSSYDYNLTAQLATDGIIDKEIPDYLTISTSRGIIPRNEREWLLDH
jgi:hypothetical protein